jgi:aminoglycoside phosphotransferase
MLHPTVRRLTKTDWRSSATIPGAQLMSERDLDVKASRCLAAHSRDMHHMPAFSPPALKQLRSEIATYRITANKLSHPQ